MYLDPQAQAIADQLAHLPRPDFSTLSVADYRAMLAAFPMPSDGDDGLASVTDDSLPGPGGPLAVRIFRPVGAAPLPLTVFFHGGGFISCGIDTHTNLCSRLAALSGSIVAAVDYRLAPEHRFPAAVDDTIAAVRALHQRAADFGADPDQIAVAGDSAGATGALAQPANVISSSAAIMPAQASARRTADVFRSEWMWLFILEAFAALLLFVFIIWWTMFSGRKNGELQDESQDQSSNSP